MAFGGSGSKWLNKLKEQGQKALDKLDGGDHNAGGYAAGPGPGPGQMPMPMPMPPQHHPQQQQQQQFQAMQQNQASHAPSSNKLHVAYFTNWSIYGRKYHPTKVPVQQLTHILYAFADVRDNGEVFLTDTWSDVEIHYDGDSWNDEGKNLYGNFKHFLRMKQSNRHLKLLLSIGGWTYSPHFAKPMLNPQARTTFVQSAMRILEDVGLDGLDIDWEYPKNDKEAQAYVDLLRELRQALDARANAFHSRHWLSIAAPCGEQMRTLHVRQMDAYLDMWNLMAYDFSGTWSDCATHQANLFDTPQTSASVQAAVDFYTRHGGVAPHKLIIGLPLYARAFANTKGLGHKFNGVPEGGAEPGNFFYADLPLKGHVEQFDQHACATYSQCNNRAEFASYDGPQSVDAKCDYVKRTGLGGVMWWELSGDVESSNHERALIPRAAARLHPLDTTSNSVQYPYSQYDNVRSGQPL